MESTTPFAGYIKPADRINYSVLKAEIVTDQSTGNKYLRRELQDADDEEEAPFTLVNFNTHMVELWERDLMAILNKVTADTRAEIEQLPEGKRFVKYAGKVDFTFPEPMHRVWGSDGNHTMLVNGQPVLTPHHKGDVVTDGFGIAKVYQGTRVLVKFKKQDSDLFTEGYDYTSACMDALRQFRSVNAEVLAPQTVVTVGQPAPMQTGAPSQQQAPVSQPTVQPAPQMMGAQNAQQAVPQQTQAPAGI